MLNPTDVRVGNWVFKITGTDTKGLAFFDYKPMVLDEHYYSMATVCFPIPLSPDMLGKCGFKHEFGDWYKNLASEDREKGLPFLRYKHKSKTWYWKEMVIPAQPRYVHQLQNLYYVLTGKELTTRLGIDEDASPSGPVTLQLSPIRTNLFTPVLPSTTADRP